MSSTALVPVKAPAPIILCAQQGEIRIEFDDDGNASIIQKNWPDEDSVIHISRGNTQTFLDGVCDAFGVQTFGGSAMNLDIANPYCEQSADLLHDDVFTLAGFTMAGPGLGRAVRERFVGLAAGLMRKLGPSAFEMPKRAAAIHEAGHVVINSALGVRTSNVLIDLISRGGKLYWIGYTDAPKLAFVDTPASPVGFDDILARSRITYAGLAAELLFAGDDRREGSSLDEIIMSQLLAEHAALLVGASAPDLWRDQVAAWCADQLHRNRRAHCDIADALMSRGRLKGKALRELCAKVSLSDEMFPDIQDHTSQLADAEIIPNDAEVWA